MENHSGTIIFANGKECIIYEYQNQFIKKKHIIANLIKRHKKGGQSSVRFARLADESRIHYVSYIIDNLNNIKTNNNWLFGSEEITNMIYERTNEIHIIIKKGGFYNFDISSITNTQYWLSFIKNNTNDDSNEKIFEQIVKYLDTNPDYLDFDLKNVASMKWFITKLDLPENIMKSKSLLKLETKSKYFERLNIFSYIGVKYFNYEIDEN